MPLQPLGAWKRLGTLHLGGTGLQCRGRGSIHSLEGGIHRISGGGGVIHGAGFTQLVHQLKGIGCVEERTGILFSRAVIQFFLELGAPKG